MRLSRLSGVTAALIVAACSSDPTGPDRGVLVGLFGNPDQLAQLVALHASAEVQFPCGEYFAVPGPIRLNGDLTFRSAGRYYPMSFGIPAGPRDGFVVGAYDTATGRVHLHLDLGGDDPRPYDLQSGVSAGLDHVVCALSATAG